MNKYSVERPMTACPYGDDALLTSLTESHERGSRMKRGVAIPRSQINQYGIIYEPSGPHTKKRSRAKRSKNIFRLRRLTEFAESPEQGLPAPEKSPPAPKARNVPVGPGEDSEDSEPPLSQFKIRRMRRGGVERNPATPPSSHVDVISDNISLEPVSDAESQETTVSEFFADFQQTEHTAGMDASSVNDDEHFPADHDKEQMSNSPTPAGRNEACQEPETSSREPSSSPAPRGCSQAAEDEESRPRSSPTPQLKQNRLNFFKFPEHLSKDDSAEIEEALRELEFLEEKLKSRKRLLEKLDSDDWS
ncbi:hypothetical protein KEM55_007550 [Ascosphaera atra]|nr:hypothetical protein KEM55_007550 [Ascosphaera atra]